MALRTQIRFFQLVAILEAISWAGLLAGMYLKYLTDVGEVGVKIFGPIHGGIFIAYVLATLFVSRQLRWSARTTLAALACSIPPFATLVFEVWALRSGRLAVSSGETASEPVRV